MPYIIFKVFIMTSSNGNICSVTSRLCGEFTGQRWVNSPHKGQWRGGLMFSLICVWTNGWVNNREAGDLRCHRAHYDVIIMFSQPPSNGCVIDPNHKSHSALVPYPTVHHSEQKYTHFCSEWCNGGYGTGALWDLWIWSITQSYVGVGLYFFCKIQCWFR